MDDLNAPATKGDIQQLRTEMKGDLQQLRQVDLQLLRAEMSHQYNDLVERISDSETKLLQAFYTYAESNSKRVAAIEMDSAGLKSRLSTIEERLTDVEKRLNMPPQQ